MDQGEVSEDQRREAQARWAAIEADWLGRKGIGTKKMLTSMGLHGPAGKVFAFSGRGMLMIKLPADRVLELVGSGVGEHLRNSRGTMREWVAIGPDHGDEWAAFVDEAHAFVEGA